jgi:phosphoribosylamine--glycine ligase/phosphoribosylformylglycinamidine cyclo-ligase
LKYLDSISYNIVIKASGLAAGKGVILPDTKDEAKVALKEIMVDGIFGSAGILLVLVTF